MCTKIKHVYIHICCFLLLVLKKKFLPPCFFTFLHELEVFIDKNRKKKLTQKCRSLAPSLARRAVIALFSWKLLDRFGWNFQHKLFFITCFTSSKMGYVTPPLLPLPLQIFRIFRLFCFLYISMSFEDICLKFWIYGFGTKCKKLHSRKFFLIPSHPGAPIQIPGIIRDISFCFWPID